MEDQVKNIISRYIKVPAEQISPSTIIDRTAVAGSIVLHRMYAALASEGITINDYWDIKNFGALLAKLNKGTTVLYDAVISGDINTDADVNGIGIDVEEIKSMPQVNEFRTDEFYKMNFTQPEIAYCILQRDALASFAGLFAAKEAIVKASNNYKNKPFNSIHIDHLPTGKPFHNEFKLSISHTNELAIAVAVHDVPVSENSSIVNHISHQPHEREMSFAFWISLLALLIAMFAIVLLFYKK